MRAIRLSSRWLALGLLIIAGTSFTPAVTRGKKEEPAILRVAADTGFFEGALREKGYPCDTPEQLKQVAKSGDGYAREAAFYLLAHRLKKEAIPSLKDGLKDPDPRIRTVAARLLGAFGDRSGVLTMRQDLATLAPDNGAPDPNMQKLTGKELRRATGERFARLKNALEAARGLSELKDPSGLQLAARLALESDHASFRSAAIRVLVNLAKCDRSILKDQSIDPESVLLTVAESETRETVLGALMRGCAELRFAAAKPILEKLASSPHLSEKDRKGAQRRLAYREREAHQQSQARPAEPRK
jgi:HEAT repeat protein